MDCNSGSGGGGYTLPGEPTYPSGWEPAVTSPVSDGIFLKSKTYQFGATGGCQPYKWEVSGTGASIDTSGVLTLSSSATGEFIVTATDRCKHAKTYTGYAGSQWVSVYYLPTFSDCGCAFPRDIEITGNVKKTSQAYCGNYNPGVPPSQCYTYKNIAYCSENYACPCSAKPNCTYANSWLKLEEWR